MKNKLICLALCMFSLAVSMLLLINTIDKEPPVINRGETAEKEDKPDPIIPSVDPDPSGSETVDSNEKGAIALAKRIEEFVERLAYGNDKSYEDERRYIIDNAKSIAAWMSSEGNSAGADYMNTVAGMFEKSITEFTSDAAFSTSVSAMLKSLDTVGARLSSSDNATLCPKLDTEVGGSLTLALLSIHDAQTQKASSSSDTFTVTVGGTVLLGDRVGVSGQNSFKNYFDRSRFAFPLYKLSAVLSNDDLSFVTLMAPLTSSTESTVLDPMKGLPAYAGSLLGVDCVSVAPAEISTYGEKGYNDTLNALSSNGISYSVQNGSNFADTAFGKVVYITFDLTDTEVSDTQRDRNKEIVKNAVKNERENGADLVIVMLHWNTRQRDSEDFSADYIGTVTSEYEQHFDAYNKEIARAAIGDGTTGADLVVGTGAHVVQGFEMWRGKMIVYSAGDLSYSGALDPSAKNTNYALLFSQTFKKENGVDKSVSWRVIPVINTSDSSPYLPTAVFDSRADEIIETVKYQSSYFASPVTEFNYIRIEK